MHFLIFQKARLHTKNPEYILISFKALFLHKIIFKIMKTMNDSEYSRQFKTKVHDLKKKNP